MREVNQQLLTNEEVEAILNYEESWFIDKKGKKILPSKLSHTISALANYNGGDIYLGLSHTEDKNQYYWDGFENIEETNPFVDVIDSILPNFNDCKFSYYSWEDSNKIILHIAIAKTNYIVKATNGTVYLRVGAQNIPITNADRLIQLERDKGISSYEDEWTSYPYEELKDSCILNNFIRNVVPSSDSNTWLKREQLLNKDCRISVAGVLLYAEVPQAILSKRSGIRITKYLTDNEEGYRDALEPGYPISVEGDIHSLIRTSVEKTIQIVEESSVLGQFEMETRKYPEVTLHEIIANAVLHRDYSIQSDIQIRVFTNRIEIESPGRLPGHITLENILDERCSRNGKVVRLISKFPDPPNKDLGEGLNTAFDAMVQMSLRRPIIKEINHGVLVIIKHERLADHEKVILDYLKNNASISNKEARKLTSISDTHKMLALFKRLRTQGQIELLTGPGVGGGASRWKLAGKHELLYSEELLSEYDENDDGQMALNIERYAPKE